MHREAETFDRKQAANAWIVKREGELKRPGGLEQKVDPTLAAVIDRYIDQSRNVVLWTKAQVLIRRSYIMTSRSVIASYPCRISRHSPAGPTLADARRPPRQMY
jgi:hypothetical protein